jgi:hypothetical protein
LRLLVARPTTSCFHRSPCLAAPILLKKAQNLLFNGVMCQNGLHLQQRNKMSLARSFTIRQLLAGFFLVLFAFGITPKITLHNLVANHKDGRAKGSIPITSTTQFSTASFNCQCDNLISESPFVPLAQSCYVTVETSFAAYKRVYVEAVYSTQQFCSSLRGPPAC